MDPAPSPRLVRFGTFEVDLQARELRRNGVKVKLQDQPFQVLVALLDRPAEIVTRKELRRQLWPDDTFVDFENSLNAAVNRLREALNDSADNPRFVETIPRHGYRFIAPVRTVDGAPLGHEAAAAAAPAEAAGQEATSSSRVPRWRRRIALFALAAAAVLATLIGADFGSWRQRLIGRPRLGRIQSIAVLPLENLSRDPEQEYFVEGMTDELITDLAKISALRVISRTSVMRYKGTKKSLPEIARELNVDAVVEGTVTRSSGRVHITAQLIRARPEQHLWAESYDRALGDAVTLQAELAREIVNTIRIKLTPQEQASLARARPVNPEAYQAYLRARYYDSATAGLSAESAVENYTKAIEKDPSYALAYAGLARAYIFGVRTRPKIALATAHEAAKKALELDPASPEAQITWAMTKLYYEHDLAGADKEFRRALEMDPGNADAHFYYSQCLAATGRFEEALAAARRAQQLDPFSTLISHYIGRLYYFARQYERAIEELQKTLELNPNYPWAHIYLVTSYERMHKYDQAVAHRQKYWALIGKHPEDVAELGKQYASSGYRGVLGRWAEGAKAFAAKNGYLTSTELTHVYAEMGETQEALRWLEKAVDDHTRDLIYIKVEPGFDSLRPDPRFQDLLRRVGLAP